VAGDKLSAKEAALIAQVREQFGLPPAAGVKVQPTAQVARVKRSLPAAATGPVARSAAEARAPEGATPGPALDPAERVAALIASARAESERRRTRQRKLYLWAPVVIVSVAALWTLLWM